MIYRFNPTLTRSQFEFRIRLAEKRLESYPLDSLDFVMMDLEHPATKSRHADQCTTDLTGRTIEFLAAAHRILPDCDDTRMNELFHRMTLKGDYSYLARRYIPYMLYSSDAEAYKCIAGVYDRMVEEVEKNPAVAGRYIDSCGCSIEGIAEFYAITGDERYVKLAKAIAEAGFPTFENAHSHASLTILRAILKMGYLSGDKWFLDIVRPYREKVLKAQCADGSISEAFPRSYRNEGCSTADWIMVNLRYWALTGDETALDVAENSMLNGLFFNQFITGGFGHRNYRPDFTGYGTQIEEAWWCCTQTGGMAMIEFAENAVVLIEDENGGARIHVNYPVPGNYQLNYNGKDITVKIISEYPATYDVNIRVFGGGDLPLTIRKPKYTADVDRPITCNAIPGVPGGKAYNVSYPIGHYFEELDDGWVLKYGPLLLAPLIYGWDEDGHTGKGTGIPEGYLSESMGGGSFYIMEPEEKDEYGFWKLACGTNLPAWHAFDDGAGSRTGTMYRAPAIVNIWNERWDKTPIYFHPISYQTCNLTFRDIKMCFGYLRPVNDETTK